MRSTTFRSRCLVSALAIGVGASIVGEASATVVLSNGPGTGTAGPTRYGHAVQFTTGAGAWNLNSVSFYATFTSPVTLQIWTVNGASSPVAGTLVGSESLSLPGIIMPLDTYTISFSGSGLSLAGATSYWAVLTSDYFVPPETATAPTAQNGSGWSGSSSAFSRFWNGSAYEWTNEADNIYYSLNATSASAVPGAGLAGLATLGFAGVSRRRRR